MLSQIRLNDSRPCEIKPDERWSRDLKEDMKNAIDLLWKFKEGLDKLHPECICLIEKMLMPIGRQF